MSGCVLIVEDDRRIAEWVQTYLERAGFTAEIARDGRAGLDRARKTKPDLVILDLTLPYLDGVSLCETLRRESDVPIIMLTAREAPADGIRGLESGADDYIVKPFEPDEVVARVEAVLRRVHGTVPEVITAGNISLNPTAGTVTVSGETVTLTQAQFALLTTFLHHQGHVLSRDQLIELSFDEFDGFDRAIDTQIARLRKRIERGGSQPIQTVYGAGYRFVAVEE